ncbi:hypothetical protein FB567DRAFT_233255 [Paraphoma chrysanthemicola]|uniref:Uncharacterized protein n=1 Tax=Paraphoma chrysanthemicola TaxID=798071 RepID=A0A8K0W375_9PLEO|nr:hypothetical protein FB567DRAFT_233255 [Paraphoma chrysanthemicola]
MSASSTSTRPSPSVIQSQENESRSLPRRTCSFLEPLEGKRSNSGKPYTPPRMKSPAPEVMSSRSNSSSRSVSEPSKSTPLRPTSIPNIAMTLFKCTNSAAVYASSNIDLDAVMAWVRRIGKDWAEVYRETKP